MKRSVRAVVLLASLGLLSACGFHLRGVQAPLPPLPFASLTLVQGGSLTESLQQAFRRDGRLQLQAGGEAVLSVVGEDNRKDILTINRSGKVNEYLLTLRVDATVQRKGDDAPLPLSVTVRREMNYSDAELLGKEREEAMLWQDMRRDAAEQLVRRLAHLPPAGSRPANAAP